MQAFKKTLFVIVFSIVCTILASCHVSLSSIESVVARDKISIENADSFHLYSYRSSEGAQTKYQTEFEMNNIYVPIRMKTSERINSEELGKIITSDAYYDYYCDFQFSLELSDALATVDLKSAEIGWPNGEYYREGILLRSLWATLTRNETGIESVRLLRNGQAYSKIYGYPNEPIIDVDENGVIAATTVNIPTHSQDDLDKLRASIPYSGLVSYDEEVTIPNRPSDDIIPQLEVYLKRLFAVNPSSKCFTEIEEADKSWLLSVALFNTKETKWTNDQPSPIMQTARKESGYLKEHVNITAQLLFGNEMSMYHESIPGFSFDNYSGVYILPVPVSFEMLNVPVVVDYTELNENQYEVHAVFVAQTRDEYQDENGTPIPIENLLEHCMNNSQRYSIGVSRLDDGSFICHSYRCPEHFS